MRLARTCPKGAAGFKSAVYSSSNHRSNWRIRSDSDGGCTKYTPAFKAGALNQALPRIQVDGAQGASCTLMRFEPRRVLNPLCLLFHHKGINRCRRRELHPQGSLVLSEVPLLFGINHAGKIGADDRNCTCTGLSPGRLSTCCVCCFTTSAKRFHKAISYPSHTYRMEHPQGCAPCSLHYQCSPSLSTGWMRRWSVRMDLHHRCS